MEERNSEGKATWVAVVGVVAVGLGAIATELLGSGLLEQWPVAVTIVGVILSVAKMVSEYTKSRPEKHMAMAEKARTEAMMKAADRLDPPKPSQP